jgi:hypothetical protein
MVFEGVVLMCSNSTSYTCVHENLHVHVSCFVFIVSQYMCVILCLIY